MKKLFVKLSILAAILLIVSCGGRNTQNKSDNNKTSDNNDNGAETSDSDKDQEENESQKCESGQFKCVDSESHYCNSFGEWVFDARCKDGCDSSTGTCKEKSENDRTDTTDDSEESSDTAPDNNDDVTDSGNDSDSENPDDSNTNPECSDNSFRCQNEFSQTCNAGEWQDFEECSHGCDTSTGRCIKSDDYENFGCTTGDHKCTAANSSFYCQDGFWTTYEYCPYGCDLPTGECKPAECSIGEYQCNGSDTYPASYYCNNGLWRMYETCYEGCISSTGKCKKSCYKIDNKIWSPSSVSIVNQEEALEYCNNLTLCGYSDWHLPNIDELRTLIKDCPSTETGGSCGVSENCLSASCWNDCSSCPEISSGEQIYSKLSDGGWLWSSSIKSDDPDYALGVFFTTASIGFHRKNDRYVWMYAACVRNAD